MVLTLALPWVAGASRHGVAGFLVAMGVDPASAAAGVVLCRIFVVDMEVPVGGLMLLWWVGGRLRLERGSMNGHTTTLPGGTPVSPPAGMVRTTRR
jgi:hypothetical protein